MKKLVLTTLLLTSSLLANASTFPFIGTKNFSFGGVPAYTESYTLNIKKNGNIRLTFKACGSESCDKERVLYTGKFTSVIPVKIPSYTDKNYIRLDKDGAYLLNRYKKVEVGCDTARLGEEHENDPCFGNYY